MNRTGRRPIYGPKTKRIQGYLSKEGAKGFERARRDLGESAERRVVSDGDTVDYLVRGYLRREKRRA